MYNRCMENTTINPDTGEVLEDTIRQALDAWPKVIAGLEPAVEMAARAKLAAKLTEAYNTIEGVLHDDTNDEHRYSFASAETIYRTVRAGLAEVGLAIIPFMGNYFETPILKKDNSGERRGAYLVVDFDYCLIDAETGYTLVIPWRGEVMEYGDKAFNKAATNATKYMLRTLFLLPTDKDDDPDRDSHTDRPQAWRKPQPERVQGPAPKPVPDQTAKRRDDAAQWIKAIGVTRDQYAMLKAHAGGEPTDMILEARSVGCKDFEQVWTYLTDGEKPGAEVNAPELGQPESKLVAGIPVSAPVKRRRFPLQEWGEARRRFYAQVGDIGWPVLGDEGDDRLRRVVRALLRLPSTPATLEALTENQWAMLVTTMDAIRLGDVPEPAMVKEWKTT